MERHIAQLIQALKNGIPASVVKSELLELERRKRELAARPVSPARPILHPDIGELYRGKVQNLRDALTQPDSRPQAADLLGGFVDEIRLTPQDGALSIAVKGNLAAVLTVAGIPSLASGDGCGGGI